VKPTSKLRIFGISALFGGLLNFVALICAAALYDSGRLAIMMVNCPLFWLWRYESGEAHPGLYLVFILVGGVVLYALVFGLVIGLMTLATRRLWTWLNDDRWGS